MRELTAEMRLAHWAQVMQERTASGQSIRAYCKTVGMRENVYFYWQKKLREVACNKLIETTIKNDGIASISETSTVTPSGWAVCELEDNPKKEAGLSIEIGKCRLAVNTDTNQELLAKTCRLLMSIC
jgi:putative transposase